MRRSILAALAMTAIIIGACGGNSPSKTINASGLDAKASVDYITANGKAAQAGRSVVRTYNGLDEILPNVTWRCDCGRPDDQSDSILVRGTVTAVEKGVGGYWVEREPGDITHRVPFGDPKSQINTLHLVFAVAEAVPAGSVPAVIRVGIRSNINDDIAKTASGWIGLGSLALVLNPDSGVYDDYDESLYAIGSNELLAAPIGTDGTLTLPFADHDEASGLLARTPTWASLKASATDRRLIVPIRVDGGAIMRADGPAWRE